MTSSNENILHVTGHFCGEFTGHRWIPRTKSSDADLWYFFDLRLNEGLSKQSWGWWFETQSHSLWLHCNGKRCSQVGEIFLFRSHIEAETKCPPYFRRHFHMQTKLCFISRLFCIECFETFLKQHTLNGHHVLFPASEPCHPLLRPLEHWFDNHSLTAVIESDVFCRCEL